MTPEALPRNHSLGELQDNVCQDSSNTKHNTTYIPQSFNSLASIRNSYKQSRINTDLLTHEHSMFHHSSIIHNHAKLPTDQHWITNDIHDGLYQLSIYRIYDQTQRCSGMLHIGI